MKRLLALTTALVLTIAAVAAAAGHFATFSVNPNAAGRPSVATLDVRPPVKNANPRSSVLRVAKGAKFDPAAVAGRCTLAQANNNSCPANSKFGHGTGYATAQLTGNPNKYPVQANLSLFMMRPQHAGDLAGVVLQAKVQGFKPQHAIGRVFKINTVKYGLATSFPHLGTAFKPPQGASVHVDRTVLTFGAHRTVNGKTHYLNRNPKTCNGSWPYQVVLGYASGNRVDTRTGPCTTK